MPAAFSMGRRVDKLKLKIGDSWRVELKSYLNLNLNLFLGWLLRLIASDVYGRMRPTHKRSFILLSHLLEVSSDRRSSAGLFWLQ